MNATAFTNRLRLKPRDRYWLTWRPIPAARLIAIDLSLH